MHTKNNNKESKIFLRSRKSVGVKLNYFKFLTIGVFIDCQIKQKSIALIDFHGKWHLKYANHPPTPAPIQSWMNDETLHMGKSQRFNVSTCML